MPAVRVWDWRDTSAPLVLPGHTRGVSCVTIAGNGAYAASGSMDGTVLLWELGAGALPTVVEGSTVMSISGVGGVHCVAIRVVEVTLRHAR